MGGSDVVVISAHFLSKIQRVQLSIPCQLVKRLPVCKRLTEEPGDLCPQQTMKVKFNA
jgi:hypothetical protein